MNILGGVEYVVVGPSVIQEHRSLAELLPLVDTVPLGSLGVVSVRFGLDLLSSRWV